MEVKNNGFFDQTFFSKESLCENLCNLVVLKGAKQIYIRWGVGIGIRKKSETGEQDLLLSRPEHP